MMKSLHLPYLCCFCDILHPPQLFLLVGGRYQKGLFPIIDVEAKLCTQSRLRVQYGKVFNLGKENKLWWHIQTWSQHWTDLHLSMNSEVLRRVIGSVGIEKNIGKLRIEWKDHKLFIVFRIKFDSPRRTSFVDILCERVWANSLLWQTLWDWPLVPQSWCPGLSAARRVWWSFPVWIWVCNGIRVGEMLDYKALSCSVWIGFDNTSKFSLKAKGKICVGKLEHISLGLVLLSLQIRL